MSTVDTDALINSVFKKIERKLEEEKKEAQRAVELEKFRQRQAEEERRRKRQERIVYACVFIFLAVMASLIYIAHERGMIKRAVNYITEAMISGSSVDCENVNNWKLPTCIELRQSQIDAKWSNMYLNRGGKEKPFAIHKEKKSDSDNQNSKSK